MSLAMSGTLNDQATAVIRERILGGVLKAGSRVLEIELAAELGISRGTLRAALQQLSFEGLVVQNRFRSTHVASLTREDAYEIYTLRNTLEAMASKLAAERIDPKGCAELDARVSLMSSAVESGSLRGVVEADYEIHRCILRLSGHSRLETHYKLIEPQTRLYLQLTFELDHDLNWILAVHKELVAAIKAGDAVKAEALAKDHNTPDGKRLSEILSPRPSERGSKVDDQG